MPKTMSGQAFSLDLLMQIFMMEKIKLSRLSEFKGHALFPINTVSGALAVSSLIEEFRHREGGAI